jgi:hypothetical protein
MSGILTSFSPPDSDNGQHCHYHQAALQRKGVHGGCRRTAPGKLQLQHRMKVSSKQHISPPLPVFQVKFPHD